jgi:hypothetical protein
MIWELEEGTFTKDGAVTLGTKDTNVHKVQKNKECASNPNLTSSLSKQKAMKPSTDKVLN